MFKAFPSRGRSQTLRPPGQKPAVSGLGSALLGDSARGPAECEPPCVGALGEKEGPVLAQFRIKFPLSFTLWTQEGSRALSLAGCRANGAGGLSSLNFFFFSLYFWLRCMASGILVPRPGIKPTPSAVKVWSPNHWTTRESPLASILLVHGLLIV